MVGISTYHPLIKMNISEIELRYRQAETPEDRLTFKWLIWLITFLALPRDERIKFARSQEQADLTREQLIKEIYDVRANRRPAKDSSGSTGLLLQKKTNKVIEVRRKLRRER
jgi:hypothetical protein